MDNRLAVYVMIEAVKRADSFAFETYPVATVQEEIGLRGATASAFGVNPDVGVALDITLAADIPGIPDHEQVTRLGDGAAIKIQDSSSISHPGLVAHMKTLAKERDIKYQMEILPRGGTDAGGIQRIRAGVPVITLSIPTRYVHTSIELADKDDIEATIQLLAAFLEEVPVSLGLGNVPPPTLLLVRLPRVAPSNPRNSLERCQQCTTPISSVTLLFSRKLVVFRQISQGDLKRDVEEGKLFNPSCEEVYLPRGTTLMGCQSAKARLSPQSVQSVRYLDP